MADSGQIERVTLWRIKRSKDGAWSNWHGTPTPDNDAAEKLGWEYETRTFIPEESVAGFAGELEARAANWIERYGPASPEAIGAGQQAYSAAAALLRDSVPTSLTRGERE